jgi:hypothetical protein
LTDLTDEKAFFINEFDKLNAYRVQGRADSSASLVALSRQAF